MISNAVITPGQRVVHWWQSCFFAYVHDPMRDDLQHQKASVCVGLSPRSSFDQSDQRRSILQRHMFEVVRQLLRCHAPRPREQFLFALLVPLLPKTEELIALLQSLLPTLLDCAHDRFAWRYNFLFGKICKGHCCLIQ